MVKVLETLLKLVLDQNAANKAKAGIADVDSGLLRVGRDAKQASDEMSKFFDDLDAGAKKSSDRLRELANRVTELKRKEREAAQQQIGSGLQRTSGSLSGLSSLASRTGQTEVANVLGAGGALTGVLSKFPMLITSLTATGPLVAALAAGLGVAAIALIKHNKSNEEYVAGLRKVIDRQKEYYDLLTTGTTETVQAAIKASEHERDLAQARMNDLQQQEAAYQDNVKSLGIFTGAASELAGVVDTTSKAINDAHQEYKKAEDSLKAANSKIEDYNKLLSDSTVAANDAAAAEKKLVEDRRSAIAKTIQHEIEMDELRNSASAADVQKRMDAIIRESNVIRSHIAELETLATTSEDGAKLLQEYRDRQAELNTQYAELQSAILPVVEARDQEIAVEKKTAEQIAENQKAWDKAAAWFKAQEQELADSTQSYLDDTSKMIEDGYKDRADLEKSYQDDIIKIAEDAADAAAQALQDVQQQYDKLAIEVSRDLAKVEADAQVDRQKTIVDSQREEARSAREHVRNLQKIREDAQQQETDLLLNGDFRGLFLLRQQTTNRLREEDQTYQDQRTERQIALANELNDQTDAYVREREQRILQYEQDQKDAYAAYLIERQQIQQKRIAALQEARNAYQTEQRQLQQNLTQQLLLRRQAWVQELQMASQTSQQQIQLEAQKQQALLSIAQQALAQVNGMSGGSTGRAYTGLAGALSSTTSSSQSSMAFNQTNNINGSINNPQALVSLIQSQTLTLLKGLFK